MSSGVSKAGPGELWSWRMTKQVEITCPICHRTFMAHPRTLHCGGKCGEAYRDRPEWKKKYKLKESGTVYTMKNGVQIILNAMGREIANR